jgi:hypothetical protein
MALRVLKREQMPEDLIGTLIDLASSASEFMTDQAIVVDGGTRLRADECARAQKQRTILQIGPSPAQGQRRQR